MPRRLVLSALLLLGCSDEEPSDAGLDAGAALDAGAVRDADAARDARVARDAGTDSPPADAGTDAAEPLPLREAASVFFVGHSLVNFHMPAMLADLAAEAGLDHHYAAMIGVGAPLWWIWTHPEDAGGEDAQVELPTGRYDVLVLTELIPIREHMTYSDTIEHAARFGELALDANPATQVYVYETWYDVTDPAWLENVAADRAVWEELASGLDARLPGPEVRLVPGGTALARLVEHIEAGDVDGLRSRADLFVDPIHLNDIGNYFIALVHFATIYGRSPEGASPETTDEWGQPFTAPTAEAARAMQRIAWEVVSNDPRSGVGAR